MSRSTGRSSTRSSKRIWVVKAGSQMVCDGGPLLMREWMSQVAELKKRHGIDVIWVTSGAIGSAAQKTQFKSQNRTLPQKQALSAIGQPMIMELYGMALAKNELLGAQVLLTASDMEDRARRTNLLNTLNELIAWQVVPILNENDAVATEEIKFGDNDSLSSLIACAIKAERLVLLTDVEGLCDGDPKKNPAAQLIPFIKKITPKEMQLVDSKSISARGTGGMYSKLLAAKRSNQKGIPVHLVKGDIRHNLLTIATGGLIGTQIGGRV